MKFTHLVVVVLLSSSWLPVQTAFVLQLQFQMAKLNQLYTEMCNSSASCSCSVSVKVILGSTHLISKTWKRTNDCYHVVYLSPETSNWSRFEIPTSHDLQNICTYYSANVSQSLDAHHNSREQPPQTECGLFSTLTDEPLDVHVPSLLGLGDGAVMHNDYLWIKYTLRCALQFFGQNCDVFCSAKPTDSFTCDVDGNKVCKKPGDGRGGCDHACVRSRNGSSEACSKSEDNFETSEKGSGSGSTLTMTVMLVLLIAILGLISLGAGVFWLYRKREGMNVNSGFEVATTPPPGLRRLTLLIKNDTQPTTNLLSDEITQPTLSNAECNQQPIEKECEIIPPSRNAQPARRFVTDFQPTPIRKITEEASMEPNELIATRSEDPRAVQIKIVKPETVKLEAAQPRSETERAQTGIETAESPKPEITGETTAKVEANPDTVVAERRSKIKRLMLQKILTERENIILENETPESSTTASPTALVITPANVEKSVDDNNSTDRDTFKQSGTDISDCTQKTESFISEGVSTISLSDSLQSTIHDVDDTNSIISTPLLQTGPSIPVTVTANIFSHSFDV